jgi:KaiC/GvpD/RAD55 family RecA-like ATPase
MEPSTSQPPALSTGIAGLDELLRGGFIPNRMYLVEGLPGAGKTTLGMQFLLEGRDAASGRSTSPCQRRPLS